MKLLFDARYIRTDFHDGISRYATELGNALARQTEVTFILSDIAQLKLLPPKSKHVIIHPVTSWREPFTALNLNKYHPDVVVTPLQTMGSIGKRFKLVLTVQDLTYYKYSSPPPQYSPLLRFGWWLYHLSYVPERIVLRGASLIATISYTVKREIIEARLTNKPIVVVANSTRDLSELLDSPVRTDGTPKNLVYMGAFIPYKNAETLIAAMEWLPGKILHLLSRIKPGRKQQLTNLIPKGANVVFHNGVTDEEYAKLLADNAILVTASKAEGFGLPVLEAQKLGVPTVVSDIEIFHEVAGDGTLYADPEDPQNFAAKIASLDDKKLRDQIIAKGKKQADTFSWDESAIALLDAIDKL
jgi:glycosyltransferase involved in cell wall biosynthesis